MIPGDRPALTEVGLDEPLHGADDGSCHVHEHVDRWNVRAVSSRRSDAENYVDGDIKLLFEYAPVASSRKPGQGNAITNGGVGFPTNIAVIVAERELSAPREVRQLASDHLAGQTCVISRWNELPVLVPRVLMVEQVEQLVPSRLTVGSEIHDEGEELWRHPVGKSVLHGFLKPCRRLGKRELNISLAAGFGYRRRHDLPIGMIERGAKPVKGVAAYKRDFIYDGFVLFGERGALAGVGICFDDIREGALFAEQLVKLSDVFSGPINLERSTAKFGHER